MTAHGHRSSELQRIQGLFQEHSFRSEAEVDVLRHLHLALAVRAAEFWIGEFRGLG